MQAICYNTVMKIICDYKNKRFVVENLEDKHAEKCVEMLNYSVSVPQIVNLSFEDVALELRDRRIYFVTTEGSDLKNAVQGAIRNVLEEVGLAHIHCVVILIAGGLDLTFEKTDDALQNIPELLPDKIIHFGIKIDESLTDKNGVFLIVSE